jgi:hypothetical protein
VRIAEYFEKYVDYTGKVCTLVLGNNINSIIKFNNKIQSSMEYAVLHSTSNRRKTSLTAAFEVVPAVGVRRVMTKFLGVSIFCFCLATQAWSLDVSKYTVLLDSYGQNHELTDTIKVEHTGDWTVTVHADVDWLTLDTVAGDGSNYTLTASGDRKIALSGNGNGRFTVRALVNGDAEREGALTVAAGGPTKTIIVMQDWGAVIVDGIKYGRSNPGNPSDPYLSVLSKDGGYSGAIVIPDTLEYKEEKYIPESISDQAFAGCSELTSITLPRSVKEIGYAAFYGCEQITSISLPGSLTEIGAFAFANAAALITLEVGWNTPPEVGWDYGTASESSIFHGEYDANYSEIDFVNCKLIVPSGTKGLYQGAPVWEKFQNIVEATLSVVADTIAFEAEATGDTIIAVASDVSAWTAVKEPADAYWLTLTGASGSGDGAFTITIAANDSTAREAKIIVANTSAARAADTIVVTQAANPAFNVPTDSLFFTSDASLDSTIQVTAYAAWTAAKDSAWIILNPESPSGNKPGSFTVAVEENPGVERTGKVTVTNGTTTDTIYVTQATSRKIVLSTDSLFFGAGEEIAADEELVATVAVAAYIDWIVTVSNDATWLAVDPAEGTGEGSFTVTATHNEDEEERKALIIVASESHSDTIYVTQATAFDNSPSFEEGGIHYHITGSDRTEVEVIASETDAYTGKVIIPSTVTHSKRIYNVTTIGAEVFAGSDITYLGLPLSLDSVGENAFKNCLSLDSIEIRWTSLDKAYPGDILYAFAGVPVTEITLIVPKGTKALYREAELWQLFNIVESTGTPAGVAKAAEAVTVRAAAGRLYVDSPAAEAVYVYSFTGKLLRTAAKASGQATFDAPAEKLIIVRGSSGWAKKLILVSPRP